MGVTRRGANIRATVIVTSTFFAAVIISCDTVIAASRLCVIHFLLFTMVTVTF